jgi:ABC-type uncharacterized transport system auxiliary subunit
MHLAGEKDRQEMKLGNRTVTRALSGGFFLLCLFLLAMAAGCSGSLFSTGPAPLYYQIDYPFAPSGCTHPFKGVVRIWPFGASPPFDQEQMVITSPSLDVSFSSHYKWIKASGDMVANALMRDLSVAMVFDGVVPATDPMPAAYGMSGQIYRFSMERTGSTTYAVLDLEINLWQEKPRAVLFRKHFHYQSPPLDSTDPGEFASAMAKLTSSLSIDLRNDLCAIMQGNSHPAVD